MKKFLPVVLALLFLVTFVPADGYGQSASFEVQSVRVPAITLTTSEHVPTILYFPTVLTTEDSSITHNSAQSGGNVTNTGGDAVTARGVCWSTSIHPTTSDSKTTDGTGTGSFTSSITGLSPNTSYYVRAYGTNSEGTGYGNQITFTTLHTIPTITTTEVSSITRNSAQSGGNVTDTGGDAVTAKGVCWSTSSNPTTSDSTTSDGTGTGPFTSYITGLSPGTTYYARAYATNSEGTGYGDEVNFTTLHTIPTITTTEVSSITRNSAQSGGDVTDTGGYAVTAKGVCWSTSTNPTISDSTTTDGTGTGVFTSSITGLSPNTTYYVRAYGTNSVGTGYGNEVNFTTTDDGDGVTESEESGPDGNDPGYDGNNDGTPDSNQSNVTSMHTTDGNNYVTLSCPDSQDLTNVSALDNPSPLDSPAATTFPYGFFDFTISGLSAGGATTLTITLPAGQTASSYWKYGPTPDDTTDHWYEFLYDGTTGAVITGNTIVLHFVDGQRGDDDLLPNGTVVDQGGPAVMAAQGTQPIPTLNEWGMIILSLLVGITAIVHIRRRNGTA